ncbi:type IV pilus modification PilV family protein [Candidatus Neptunochlamydia vexilliferae]|uniref:type IV pilus modification PilV family protein n=1 Tax=Candidatus Neptunichlamydia vexilliferae TaxID=1651774 RepID=UPI00189154C6|nr:hypothetical protein [Candidatus Neptunochlamydia vexilliferae]
MHRQRPFVLIEVFIAIALLAVCAFPLIRYPLFAYKQEQKHLIEMELQRHAELIFYDVLKHIDKYNWEEFPRKNTKKPERVEEITVSIPSMSTFKKASHCHIYNAHKKAHTHKLRHLHCDVCFGGCNKKTSYKFVFLAKKVAKKSVDGDVGDDEGSPSDIQAVRESGG